MRTSCLTLALMLVVAAPLIADTDSRKPKASITTLSFLTGSWEGKAWGGTYRAHYTPPSGKTLLSFSQLYKKNKAVYHEFERFTIRNNTVILTPYPQGRPAKSFTLVAYTNTKKTPRAVFENPKKDFPTRIVYERTSKTQLTITLSDPHNKSKKVQVFNLNLKLK